MSVQILIGAVLTGCLAALFHVSSPEMPAVAWTLAGLCALQAIGWALVVSGHRRPGAYAVMVGSLPIIPAGLIGALGARRVLDDVAAEEFAAD